MSHVQVTPTGGTGAGCSSHGSSACACSSQQSHPPRFHCSLSPDRHCSKVTLWVCTLSSFCASRLHGQRMLTLPRVSLFPSPAFRSNPNSQAQPCSSGSSPHQSQSHSTIGQSPDFPNQFFSVLPLPHLPHWKGLRSSCCKATSPWAQGRLGSVPIQQGSHKDAVITSKFSEPPWQSQVHRRYPAPLPAVSVLPQSLG